MIERPLDQWLLRQLAALERDTTMTMARRAKVIKEYGRMAIEAARMRRLLEEVTEAENRADATGKAVWEEVEQVIRDWRNGRIL